MPNTSKLGAYIAPTHDPRRWQSYLHDIDPPLVRILMPGAVSTNLVSQVYGLCPKAKLSLRWWDIDDGGDEQKARKLSSVRAASDAATEDYDVYLTRYVAMKKEATDLNIPFPPSFQVYFNSLNETPTFNHEMRPAIAAYCQRFVQYAESAGGPNVIVGEFGVGHPEEWPPVWDWFQPVIDDFDEGDMLSLHEYWQPEGPMYEWTDEKGQERKDWGALAGRYTHCPFNVPIAITECGVDGRIYNRNNPPDTGYLKFMSPTGYSGQVGSYLAQLKKDPRIVAATPFETDFADKEWASFDCIPAQADFVRVLEAMNEGSPSVPSFPPIAVPPVGPVLEKVPERLASAIEGLWRAYRETQ